MPVVTELLRRRTAEALQQWGSTLSLAERNLESAVHSLIARVNIPSNSSSPAGLIQANTVDPWKKSGKYALAWVYFCVIILVFTSLLHFYHAFSDRIRTALHETELQKAYCTSSPDTDYELPALQTDKSTQRFFPRTGELPQRAEPEAALPLLHRPLNFVIALFRWVFYRPLPEIEYKKGWRPFGFPPISVLVLLFLGLCLTCLYIFVPQPLYWQSIQFGSPPVAVRSGMLAVALMPWIVAMAMKANLVTAMTGIGHERLNVLHRWMAYLCLLLSLIHTVPFYIQPLWNGAQNVPAYNAFFKNPNFYVYGTGTYSFS
jgi:Ferric reductase like transmembrane component